MTQPTNRDRAAEALGRALRRANHCLKPEPGSLEALVDLIVDAARQDVPASSARPRLVRLPNDQWVDPATVKSIVAFPRRLYPSGAVLSVSHVTVTLTDGTASLIKCESDAEAEAMKDRIVAIVHDEDSRRPEDEPAAALGDEMIAGMQAYCDRLEAEGEDRLRRRDDDERKAEQTRIAAYLRTKADAMEVGFKGQSSFYRQYEDQGQTAARIRTIRDVASWIDGGLPGDESP
jgi:hypothetical protein